MARFYVRTQGSEIRGPFSVDEIIEMARSGEIPRSTDVLPASGQPYVEVGSSTHWCPMIREPAFVATFARGNVPEFRPECKFRVFRANRFTSWEDMARQVSEFLTEIGRDRVVTVAQSEDSGRASMVVWYWTARDSAESTGDHTITP